LRTWRYGTRNVRGLNGKEVKWEENVRRGLQERGVDWRQARKKAMDRSTWRSLV
jgi:hypothetical protein